MSNTTAAVDLNFYGYTPNEPAAYVSAAIFGVLGLVVLALNVRFKSWFLMAVPIASFMEVIGLALRPSSSYDLGPYIAAILCVLLAPTVFAIADYGLIGKIMLQTGIHHPVFKPSRVRWLFLMVDIASFFVQCIGGSMTASHDIQVAQTGSRIVLGGLCLALCVFIFYLFLLTYVYKVFVTKGLSSTAEGKNVRVILFVLLADMILLIIRSAYRVAEFGDLQYRNSISINEHLFYGLDTTEMALLSALWIPFHPGFWGMAEGQGKTEKAANLEMADAAVSVPALETAASPQTAAYDSVSVEEAKVSVEIS